MFSLAGCGHQTDGLIKLKHLYFEYKREQFYADYVGAHRKEPEGKHLCKLADVRVGSLMHYIMMNLTGVVPDRVIYSTDTNFIFAQEYSSVSKASEAWNNYYEKGGDLSGVYVQYKNIIACWSAYDWLTEDYPYDLLPTGEGVLNGSILYFLPEDVTGEYKVSDGISIVSSMVFLINNNFTYVNFNNVKILNAYACAFADRIKNVSFGKNLQTIGCSAFEGCTSLQTVIIPKNVKYIGLKAFTSGTIYVEGYKQRPDGWAEQFTYGNVKVYWDGEWYYDDNGNPTPNN